MENKCPKCGAAGSPKWYECGSYIDCIGNHDQSPKCRIRELEQQLAAARQDERDRLLLIVSEVRQQAFEKLAITSQLEVPWIVACDKIRDAVRRETN